MNSVATVEVLECGGDVFIPIPEEMCEHLGASIGTVFSVEANDDERVLVLTVEHPEVTLT